MHLTLRDIINLNCHYFTFYSYVIYIRILIVTGIFFLTKFQILIIFLVSFAMFEECVGKISN